MPTSLDDRWHRRYAATRRRLELKERALAYKGGCCSLCGYDRCPQALVFHHLDPDSKDFEISSKQHWARVRPELDKTILVCANCHSEIHAGLYPSLLGGCLEEGFGGSYNEIEAVAED